MKLTGVLAMLLAFAVAATLSACGGGGDSSGEAAATAGPGSTVATGGRSGGGGGEAETPPADRTDGDAAGGDGASGASGKGGEVKAPKAPGQRTLPSGAVQSLPPSPAAQQKALDNSYGSIKAFGTEASPGADTTAITGALQGFLAAKAAGDWAATCSLLSWRLDEGVQRYAALVKRPNPSCAQILGAVLGRVPKDALARQAQIDVAEVRIDGDRGFVIYSTPESVSADMPMYLEGGAWKVGAIEAYAL